jgi:hypothetical protein
MRRRPAALTFVALVACAAAGCGVTVGPETGYGRSRTDSVNGTRVIVNLFRERGHDVRVARRQSDELRDWADAIVRFSQHPGPPSKDEAEWYSEWLSQQPGRSLVYVPHDYDATVEYWDRALAQLPKGEPERTRERIAAARKPAVGWEGRLPPVPKSLAPAAEWFSVEKNAAPTVCQKLGGPWATGLDPKAVDLTRHDTLKVEAERVLLSGDGKPLVVDWWADGGSRVLVPANGAFLLNLPLTEPSRWPLAARTALWVEGDDTTDASGAAEIDDRASKPAKRLRVAFLEGSAVTAAETVEPSPLQLLKVWPFGAVAAQLFFLGLAACLARAPRLGRPRPAAPSGADRPAAHPEALGALLARAGRAGEARALLDTYRRWRGGPSARETRGPA